MQILALDHDDMKVVVEDVVYSDPAFDPFRFVFNPLDQRLFALDYVSKEVLSAEWDGNAPLPEIADLDTIATPTTLPMLGKLPQVELGVGSTDGVYLRWMGSHTTLGGFKIWRDPALGWRFRFIEIVPRHLRRDPASESTPPVVLRTVPRAGATEVDSSLTEIRVTFSRPMSDNTWTWESYTSWPESLPEVTDKPRFEDDGRTCVLPVKLDPGSSYAFWMNTERVRGFQDTAGRPAVPYLLSFRTKR